MYYLYRIINTLNNKIYIGQSNKENERWRQHKYFARHKEPIQYIHRAMKKYGTEYFVYEVIAMCRTREDTNWTEELLIKQYDSRNREKGYNIAPGGGFIWQSGLPSHMYPMYGKHQSESMKEKLREMFKGKVLSPGMSEAGKQRMIAAHKGKIVSEETKRKISKTHSGKPLSKEHKQKLSNAKIGGRSNFEGKNHSDKTKQQISLTQRKFDLEIEKQMVEEYACGMSAKMLGTKYKCGWRTVYRIIKRHKVN